MGRSIQGLVIAAAVPAVALITTLPGTGAAPRPAGAVNNTPVERINATDTQNWAGYVATSGAYTSVSASWVEPRATCSSDSREDVTAFWVGLDGGKKGDDTVEQTGTEAICQFGLTAYAAWYEMYPSASHPYQNTVDPGDHLSASVAVKGSSYTLIVADATRGWREKTVRSLKAATDATAEVIAEAPATESSNGKIRILPLADFGKVGFTSTMVDGADLGASKPGQLTMTEKDGTVKAAASSISGSNRFTVTWHHS